MWQDRADSTITLDSRGNITVPATNPVTGQLEPCTPVGITSGGSGPSCNPNAPTQTDLAAETIQFQAHPNLNLSGAIYQPQGATFNFTGSGNVTSALQIITGGVTMSGSDTIQLVTVANPTIRFIVALIH